MGLIPKHLCKHTIHTYGMHTQNALDDPTRSSGVAGSSIWPVFALLWYKTKNLVNFSKFKNILTNLYLIFIDHNR